MSLCEDQFDDLYINVRPQHWDKKTYSNCMVVFVYFLRPLLTNTLKFVVFGMYLCILSWNDKILIFV